MYSSDKIAITGVNGFVGQHLANYLFDKKRTVYGIGNEPETSQTNKRYLEKYFQQNLIESWPTLPDVDCIIHLAGLAAVGPSFDNPQLYINANSSMLTNLCEYYINQGKSPRIIIISSGAVYDSNQPMPIAENGVIKYSSPYVVSKILVEKQAAYYRSRGLDCVVVRPFNHIGPGQLTGFILPDFYNRIKNLSNDINTIDVGNINTERDYTDVRDIVSAYTKLAFAEKLEHNLYNICSGKSISGKAILNILKEKLARTDINFVIDQKLIRPSDAPVICGDSSRLQKELDWKPEYSLDQTIQDFIEYSK